MSKKTKIKFCGDFAIAHIHTTLNNTIITISDPLGKILCWSSAGESGLKGARKKTAFAAQITAQIVAGKALDMGVQKIEVIVNGGGNGRETAIRGLHSSGLHISSIKEKIKLAYNGCRPPKKRRL